MADLQRTPLHSKHLELNARMVPFGGWDMPVQYTGIVEEHNTVRQGVGLFDISHMARLSFDGKDTLSLLEKICTNAISTMKDMQVRYSLVCNEAGGILDDVLVYRWPYGWAMVVNASNRAKIVEWIKKQSTGLDVKVDDQTETTAMIAVQGPKALESIKGLTEADAGTLKYYYATPTRCMGQQAVLSRTGYTGEDGVEIMIANAYAIPLWEELTKRGGKPCGLGCRDTLRLEAAMPLYGHELNEQTDPLQAGLAWAVKLEKGPFIGRDAIVKRKGDVSLPVRVGLELVGKRPAREGYPIVHNEKQVGTVTSGTFTPTLQKAVAMGFVPVELSKAGTAVLIDIRGQMNEAKVVPLPFYSRK